MSKPAYGPGQAKLRQEYLDLIAREEKNPEKWIPYYDKPARLWADVIGPAQGDGRPKSEKKGAFSWEKCFLSLSGVRIVCGRGLHWPNIGGWIRSFRPMKPCGRGVNYPPSSGDLLPVVAALPASLLTAWVLIEGGRTVWLIL